MTPAFDPAVTVYAATTTNATNAVTATAADSNAAVSLYLGDAAVTSPVTWAAGENTLRAVVENGGFTKTYTVNVTKS